MKERNREERGTTFVDMAFLTAVDYFITGSRES